MPIRTARRAAYTALDYFQRTPFWSEAWSGAAAALWSTITIIGAGDVTSRPSFTVLGALAGTHFWEFSGVVLGLFQMAALLSGHYPARWCGAFTLAAWWTMLTISIVQVDPGAPSWGLYAVFAVSNLVSMARLAGRRG